MDLTRADITTRADVVRLVDSFYDRVRADDLLGPIFDEVARTDWAVHLPKMYDFWDTVLFGSAAYHGQPLGVHIALSARVALGDAEFQRWLGLFMANVDAQFTGQMADEAKLRAGRIAAVMLHHVGRAQPSAALS